MKAFVKLSLLEENEWIKEDEESLIQRGAAKSFTQKSFHNSLSLPCLF